MFRLIIALALAAHFAAVEVPPADDAKPKGDALRTYYAKTAAKYEFFHDEARKQPLKLVEKPVMTWTNDGDWSGDVFVWMRDDQPEVIGCPLTGPTETKTQRIAFQEFHLLAEDPIAPADMLGQLRWAPKEGLKRSVLEGAPDPAETPALRLAQMRQLLRDFTAQMQADSLWELRLLPQPLVRYQPKEGAVVDGALFTFVWTNGTDPELILLLECRKTKDGLAWYFAPVRFTYRELWLKYHDKEVWHGPFHHDPPSESELIYTTHFLDRIVDPRLEAK